MKPIEELSKDELLALVAQKDAESAAALAAKDAEIESAKETVNKLKTQVKDKKELSGSKPRVKLDGEIYEFPSAKLTMPNHTHGGDLEIIDAEEASKDLELSGLLRDRGVLIKVSK